MQLSSLDLAMVGAYAVFIFVLAQVVSRRKAGQETDTTDYFLASKALPWWAIGASLIAANISAEQIVGMAGSGYAIGLAIASYEWMAAATLLIVAKFFLPIFLATTSPPCPSFWSSALAPPPHGDGGVLAGALCLREPDLDHLAGLVAVMQVAGVNQDLALAGLGVFALLYQIRGGLKAVALTDIVQVALLVTGGLIIAWLTLGKIGGGDVFHGWHTLVNKVPDHFHMILKSGDPHYKDLPGLSVIIGGMWIANLVYWGCNQYIIQRGLAAKSLQEAQRGMVLAGFLKLIMPVIIVLPGIAAVLLAPDLGKPDLAYPAMMRLLPPACWAWSSPRWWRRSSRPPPARSTRSPRSSRSISMPNLPRARRARPIWCAWAALPPRVRGHRDPDGAPVAGRPRSGVPVYPGVLRLRHAGHHRDLPARPVLAARDGEWRADRAIASVILSIFFRFSGIEALSAIPFMNRMRSSSSSRWCSRWWCRSRVRRLQDPPASARIQSIFAPRRLQCGRGADPGRFWRSLCLWW
jgi:SSS family solute:Na+ symporter